jgi:hypothetical protein
MFKLSFSVLAALGLCAGLYAECPANGLVVVVNKTNPTEELSMAQLKRFLLGEARAWPDKKQVVLVAGQPQSPAFKCMLSAVAHMSDSEFGRFNAAAEFRGEDPVRIRFAVNGPAAAVMVSSANGSIAIVEAGDLAAIAASVRVLKINGKQPGEAGYPL